MGIVDGGVLVVVLPEAIMLKEVNFVTRAVFTTTNLQFRGNASFVCACLLE